MSAVIQDARIASGGRRVNLAREMEVLARYRRALGKPGHVARDDGAGTVPGPRLTRPCARCVGAGARVPVAMHGARCAVCGRRGAGAGRRSSYAMRGVGVPGRGRRSSCAMRGASVRRGAHGGDGRPAAPGPWPARRRPATAVRSQPTLTRTERDLLHTRSLDGVSAPARGGPEKPRVAPPSVWRVGRCAVGPRSGVRDRTAGDSSPVTEERPVPGTPEPAASRPSVPAAPPSPSRRCAAPGPARPRRRCRVRGPAPARTVATAGPRTRPEQPVP